MSVLGPGFSQYLTEPQQVLRASAALPAAGAWDAAPTAIEVMGWTEITLLCAYTRGAQAVAGSVRFKIEVSYDNAPTVWYQTTLYQAGALVAGADVNSSLQREDFLYTSTAAAIERFVYHLELPSNVKTLRVAAREVASIAAPGTFAINAMLSF